MKTNQNQNLADRNIPGAMNRSQRFAEVEHAENAGETLKRLVTYFAREKVTVACMLAVVVFGTLCGICAPSLQSNAIDTIAGVRAGDPGHTILLMLTVYLLYSVCALV